MAAGGERISFLTGTTSTVVFDQLEIRKTKKSRVMELETKRERANEVDKTKAKAEEMSEGRRK